MKGDSHVTMKVSEFENDAKQYADADLSNAVDQLHSNHKIAASYNITNVVTVEKKACTSSCVFAAISIKGTTVPVTINYVKDHHNGEVCAYVFDSNNRLSSYCYDEIDKLVVDATSQMSNKRSITAADDDFDSMVDDSEEVAETDTDDDAPEVSDENSIQDTLEDMSNTLEDMQDNIDDVDPDLVDIELNNNIEDHYIAECSVCHGVFISAVVKSDAEIDNIHGTCPLCNREADQLLKWLIVKADSSANNK